LYYFFDRIFDAILLEAESAPDLNCESFHSNIQLSMVGFEVTCLLFRFFPDIHNFPFLIDYIWNESSVKSCLINLKNNSLPLRRDRETLINLYKLESRMIFHRKREYANFKIWLQVSKVDFLCKRKLKLIWKWVRTIVYQISFLCNLELINSDFKVYHIDPV
jgi:hypothetical protein